MAARRCLSLAIDARLAGGLARRVGRGSTDLVTLAGCGAVTAGRRVLKSIGLGQILLRG